MVNIIDLKFQGFSEAIASFLIESGDGPVLVETGPHSTFQNLVAGVNSCGYQIEDVKHVLLSHIHFDHAGAAWALAQTGAKVYVHPLGAKHLLDPSRLYESAKRIYKDQMDILWGKLEPVKQDRLIQIPDQETLKIGGLNFKAHHTPGHAIHHIAWQLEDSLFTGDVAGVRVGNGPIVAPCPPPDIHIEHWKESIGKIRNMAISKLYLTHYGEFNDIDQHLSNLEFILDDWANWIKDKMKKGKGPEEATPEFQEYVASQLREEGLNENEIGRYEAANPAWMSVAGLMRYWNKLGGIGA
ncbi:MAG: MBL fold metallo-hydrolase [Cyclobacteriaceae bacterium]